MTRDEAIAYLERADTTVYAESKTRTAEALEMAIEALKERRTSRWFLTEIHNCYDVYKCVECERKITVFHRFGDVPTTAKVTEDYPYCHCGAKMEVEE